MAVFGQTDGLNDPNEDLIIIHVGHLTEERYNKVVESVIAFMNQRWPNMAHIGIDS